MAKRTPDGLAMTQPATYLTRMALFIVIVALATVALHRPLLQAFSANPPLNGLILAVFAIGVLFAFRQVLSLYREVRWVNSFRRTDPGLMPQGGATPPALLAPMAMMLAERRGGLSLSAPASRALLDSVGSRLDEAREITRYVIGLLVFLGLLGTFWGLIQTVSSVGETIRTLNVASTEMQGVFEELRRGLEAPLAGMGTAFASSLLGLSGSLVLGFLDLQAGQAQNRFYNELEEWLSTVTRLGGSGPIVEGETSVPAYVNALLEQTADSLDTLQRTIARAEERRAGSDDAVLALSQRLERLSDQMGAEGQLMIKLAQNQIELKPLLERLARATEQQSTPFSTAAETHLRNMDVALRRLLEETTEGRTQMLSEVRTELKLLSKTIAALAGDNRKG